MCNRGTQILVGLGLACLALTGCASLVISGAMWAGKEVIKEGSKKSPEGDDAKRSEAAQTNSDATEPQPTSAAEPSRSD